MNRRVLTVAYLAVSTPSTLSLRLVRARLPWRTVCLRAATSACSAPVDGNCEEPNTRARQHVNPLCATYQQPIKLARDWVSDATLGEPHGLLMWLFALPSC